MPGPDAAPAAASAVPPAVAARRAQNRMRAEGQGKTRKQQTVQLLWKLVRQSPWYHRVFMALVVLQCIYLIIERIVLMSLNQSQDIGKNEQLQSGWFFGIIVLSALFVAHYAIHAILTVNAFEMLSFFIGSLMMAGRLIIEYVNRSDDCRGDSARLCLVFLVLAGFFNIASMGLCLAMYQDLRWKKYKAIGADMQTQALYRRYEIFCAVRKLDLQVSVISLFTGAIFFSDFSSDLEQAFFVINIILFITELFWEYLGERATKKEEKKSMYGFWALSAVLPCFIIAVAVDAFGANVLLGEATHESVRITIGIFGVLGILNRIYTVVNSVILFRKFGAPYEPLRDLLSQQKLVLYERQRVKKRLEPGKRPGAGGPPPEFAKGGAGVGAAGAAGARAPGLAFYPAGESPAYTETEDFEIEQEEVVELVFSRDGADPADSLHGVVVRNPLDLGGASAEDPTSSGAFGIELPDVTPPGTVARPQSGGRLSGGRSGSSAGVPWY